MLCEDCRSGKRNCGRKNQWECEGGTFLVVKEGRGLRHARIGRSNLLEQKVGGQGLPSSILVVSVCNSFFRGV
jgi:hypothetical protein